MLFSDESQEHGGVAERDHLAVDPEDEGERLPAETGGLHAQETS